MVIRVSTRLACADDFDATIKLLNQLDDVAWKSGAFSESRDLANARKTFNHLCSRDRGEAWLAVGDDGEVLGAHPPICNVGHPAA